MNKAPSFMAELNTAQKTLLPLLETANINPVSFLATDYLNHFNELLMMVEMLPDMPDMLEDLEDWSPKSYPDHFRESGFTAMDLAIECYEKAPSNIKVQFDRTVSDLDQYILSTLKGLKAVGIMERGFSPAARLLLEARIATMQNLLLRLNGIIHGHLIDEDETLRDATSSVESDTKSQDAIDKLFD